MNDLLPPGYAAIVIPADFLEDCLRELYQALPATNNRARAYSGTGYDIVAVPPALRADLPPLLEEKPVDYEDAQTWLTRGAVLAPHTQEALKMVINQLSILSTDLAKKAADVRVDDLIESPYLMVDRGGALIANRRIKNALSELRDGLEAVEWFMRSRVQVSMQHTSAVAHPSTPTPNEDPEEF